MGSKSLGPFGLLGRFSPLRTERTQRTERFSRNAQLIAGSWKLIAES
jgi:hypothetical protein